MVTHASRKSTAPCPSQGLAAAFDRVIAELAATRRPIPPALAGGLTLISHVLNSDAGEPLARPAPAVASARTKPSRSRTR